jgi:hypothetical protein
MELARVEQIRNLLFGEDSTTRACSSPVQLLMAGGAKGNQVKIVIRALLAAKLLVMDLQVFPGTTDLALPAIAT